MKEKLMNEVKGEHLHCSTCAILCCRKGTIFIRASYGTSHGQNNISVAVTSMWRQDESGIKIRGNEYKWCLLHLEGEINHGWTNVVNSFTFSLCCFFPPYPLHKTLALLLLLFFCGLSFPDSLPLIKLASKVSFCINKPLWERRTQRYL